MPVPPQPPLELIDLEGNLVTVTAFISDHDGMPVVQIDTPEALGDIPAIRVCLNDGDPIWGSR